MTVEVQPLIVSFLNLIQSLPEVDAVANFDILFAFLYPICSPGTRRVEVVPSEACVE